MKLTVISVKRTDPSWNLPTSFFRGQAHAEKLSFASNISVLWWGQVNIWTIRSQVATTFHKSKAPGIPLDHQQGVAPACQAHMRPGWRMEGTFHRFNWKWHLWALASSIEEMQVAKRVSTCSSTPHPPPAPKPTKPESEETEPLSKISFRFPM